MKKQTKINSLFFGKRKDKGIYYCEKCREWVPNEDKHNKKRHK